MKTNNYWEQRVMEENQKYCDLSIADQERQLKKLYKEQNEKLEAKLNKVYLKMMTDQEREGQIYINDMFRTRTYHELMAEFNARAKALGSRQVIITEKALLDMYEKSKEITEKFIPKGTITGQWMRPSAVRPEDVIKTAWVADGKNFSQRIWKDKEKLVETMYEAFAEEVMLGASADQVSKKLHYRLGVSFTNAMRLAITETAHIQIVGQVDKYKEMGFTYGRYQAVGDNRCCEICQERNGKIFPLDEIRKMIPSHCYCRCSFTLELKEVGNL